MENRIISCLGCGCCGEAVHRIFIKGTSGTLVFLCLRGSGSVQSDDIKPTVAITMNLLVLGNGLFSESGGGVWHYRGRQ